MKSKFSRNNKFFWLYLKSFHTPGHIAEYLKMLTIPLNMRVYFACLVIILNLLHLQITAYLGMIPDMFQIIPMNILICWQVAFFLSLIGVIYVGGRLLGGTGSLEQTIFLLSWVQFLLAGISFLQILFINIQPFIVALLGLLGLVYMIIFHVVFIMRLHDFKSVFKTTIGCFCGGMFIIFVLNTLFSFLLNANLISFLAQSLDNAS